MATNSTEKTYVLDTTTLIMDPEVIYRVGGVGDEVVIPMAVIKEIDGLKKSQYELKAQSAKTVSRELAMLGEYLDLKEGSQLRTGTILRIETRYEKVDALDSKADNKVVGTAVWLMKEGKNVVLLSTDHNMLTAARGYGVKAEFGVGGGGGEASPSKKEAGANVSERNEAASHYHRIRTSDMEGGTRDMTMNKGGNIGGTDTGKSGRAGDGFKHVGTLIAVLLGIVLPMIMFASIQNTGDANVMDTPLLCISGFFFLIFIIGVFFSGYFGGSPGRRKYGWEPTDMTSLSVSHSVSADLSKDIE